MFNYSHTEKTGQAIADLLAKQSKANSETFPQSVVDACIAALNSLPAYEKTLPATQTESGSTPTTGDADSDFTNAERTVSRSTREGSVTDLSDDGIRVQLNVAGQFDKDRPERTVLSIDARYVRVPV
jgi:hypothetical protein